MWQPAIGGLVIGAVIVRVPQVMGVGYEYVDQALNGGLLLNTRLLLCFLKLAATVVSYSSGNAGGIFAPSLYIGAMAGGALGTIVHRVAPFPTGDSGAYALVGMGTLFAGIIRAPMTSVFMIFEITQDYQILVPLMVANMLSFAISRRLQPAPVYHALLEQDGVHLRAAPLGTASRRTAGHIMQGLPPFLDPEITPGAALLTLQAEDSPAALVGNHDRLVGIVTRAQLESVPATDSHGATLQSLVGSAEFVHVHPDHPVEVVVERFGLSDGLLPVVSRADVRQVLGVITLRDIVKKTAGAPSPLPPPP
jgi:CIC family chloride channel protein